MFDHPAVSVEPPYVVTCGHEGPETGRRGEPLCGASHSLGDAADSFEDVDEDDISDDDCYASLAEFQQEQKQSDEADRLLDFAEMVSKDIHKYFGGKSTEEACAIYEDKWVFSKSGRELYYADLLRAAEGDSDNKHEKVYSGRMDKKIGLGPLRELFEIGLHNFILEKQNNRDFNGVKSNKGKKGKSSAQKLQIPMHQRRLPDSFWKEPLQLLPDDNPAQTMDACTFSSPPARIDTDRPVAAEAAMGSCISTNGGDIQSGVPDFSDLLELDWSGYDQNAGKFLLDSDAMDIGQQG